MSLSTSRVLALFVLAFVAACSSTGGRQGAGPSAGVTPSPHEKLGKPYQVNGVWYVPKYEPNYDAVGLASWYGPGFHGRLTANGELFDQDRLTAAHPTLPLPSIVEVTNAENGRRVRLRVNDRGPFANDRILDLSKGAAERLGTIRDGVATVRVRYIGPARLEDAILRVGEKEEGQSLLAAVGRPPAIKPGTPDPVLPEDTDLILADLDVGSLDGLHVRAAHNEAWFVQVGAFSSTGNAAAAAARLPENKPVALHNLDRGGLKLTLVRLGPFLHPFAAQEALEEARILGFPDAHIIEEVVH